MEELKKLLSDANIPYSASMSGGVSINNAETSANFFDEDGGMYGMSHQGMHGGTAFVQTAQEALYWMINADEKIAAEMAEIMAERAKSKPLPKPRALAVYNRSDLSPHACPHIVVDWNYMDEVEAVHLRLAPDQEIDLKMKSYDILEIQDRAARFLNTITNMTIASLVTPILNV
jgi:hypothetical protein